MTAAHWDRDGRQRRAAEKQFHDHQARARQGYFASHPEAWRFDEQAYLDHAPWLRPALEKMGNVHGLRVLDLGCGHGLASLVLARRGGCVVALDLSGEYICEAAQRARHNGLNQSLTWVQGDAERLPFAANSFDRVWGHAVLHHLHTPTAMAEVARVLRPDGHAVFCEPWHGNPLLTFWRGLRRHRGQRTAHERALTSADIALLQRFFARVEITPFQLIGLLAELTGSAHWRTTLTSLDRYLFQRFPTLAHWCRYVVVTLHCPKGKSVPRPHLPVPRADRLPARLVLP
ncbi:MAG: class I SAM-dependent methyltransferase [Gemmataceae bacterium]